MLAGRTRAPVRGFFFASCGLLKFSGSRSFCEMDARVERRRGEGSVWSGSIGFGDGGVTVAVARVFALVIVLGRVVRDEEYGGRQLVDCWVPIVLLASEAMYNESSHGTLRDVLVDVRQMRAMHSLIWIGSGSPGPRHCYWLTIVIDSISASRFSGWGQIWGIGSPASVLPHRKVTHRARQAALARCTVHRNLRHKCGG